MQQKLNDIPFKEIYIKASPEFINDVLDMVKQRWKEIRIVDVEPNYKSD